MPDKLIETLLAQIDSDLLIEELRRRLGLSSSAGTDNGQAVLGGSSGASAASRDPVTFTMGVIRSDEFFRLSNSEAIRKFLAIMKRPQSPRAIVDGLKSGGILSNAKNFYANVWTELKRARDRGEIVNTPSGWGLAEWYPARPKPEPAPKKGRRKRAAKTAKTKTKTKKPVAKEATKTDEPVGKGKARADSAPAAIPYRKFISETMKAGKTMPEANAAWKLRKAEAEPRVLGEK